MTPRPAHIQCQLSKGIESLYFSGQQAVYRVADTDLFAHVFSFMTKNTLAAKLTVVGTVEHIQLAGGYRL
jgi:hypothetical protein